MNERSENTCMEYLFAKLRWGDKHVCPFCGSDNTYRLRIKSVNRIRYKCRACRRQFSVTKGTILEGSKLSLAEWEKLIRLLCEAEQAPTVGELHRELNISYGAVQNALDRLAYALKRQPLTQLITERKRV